MAGRGVKLRYLGEDMVTLKEEVVWVLKVLGIAGHLSDSLVVTSLDQGFRETGTNKSEDCCEDEGGQWTR